MAYDINWALLGAPVDVGGAIQHGFEQGMQRSAFATLANDPTNQSALARLGAIDPQAAITMREHGRQEAFRTSARSAFDPATGEVDPVAMRRAYAEAGDIGGAMDFERNRVSTERTQMTADNERLRRVAGLLDDATDEASYAAARQAAITQLHADPASIPEAYDPAWVATQRRVVAALSNQQEMTTFMRDATAAGIQPGSDEFRQAFMTRYASPPRIIMGPNGQPMILQDAPDTGTGTPPPDLTDDDFADGGPAPANGAATFP